jgi:hypothetical protein
MVGKPNDYNDVTGFGRLAKDLDESDREDDPEPPSDVAEDRPDSSRQESEALKASAVVSPALAQQKAPRSCEAGQVAHETIRQSGWRLD